MCLWEVVWRACPCNNAHIIGFFTGRNDLVRCWHAGKQVLRRLSERFAANSTANPVIFPWDLIYHLRNGTLLFLNSVEAYKVHRLSFIILTRKNRTPDINKREFEFTAFHSYSTL